METEKSTLYTTERNKWNISSFVCNLRNYFDENSNSQKTPEDEITRIQEIIELEKDESIKTDVDLMSTRPKELASTVKGKLQRILDNQNVVKDSTKILHQKPESLVQDISQNLAGKTNTELENTLSKRVSLEVNTITVGESNRKSECLKRNRRDLVKGKKNNSAKSLKLELVNQNSNKITETKRKQKCPLRASVQHSKKFSSDIKSQNFAEILKTKLQNALAKEELIQSQNATFVNSLKKSFETILDDNKPEENLALFGSLYDRVKSTSFFRVSDNNTRTPSTGDQQEKFQCKYCFENFVHISNLISHTQTHSRDKPYQCKICAENFSNALHLKLHLKEHTDEKPFSCKYCPEKFAYWTDMMGHRTAAHKGNEAFQCKVCGRYFQQYSRMTRHFKIHTRPYHCEMCGKTYAEKVELVKHLKRHL